MRRRDFCTTGLLAAVLAGCSDDLARPGDAERAGPPTSPPTGRAPTSGRPSATAPTPTAGPTSASRTATPTAGPTAVPQRFRPTAAQATVTHLAGDIGPREATSTAYRRAADHVEERFAAAGLRVVRQPVRVPAGDSWGVRVPAGSSANVIATLPGFDPRAPHLVVGAHLDTVPQAPGAEDNASGVAVVLEVARMAAAAGVAPEQGLRAVPGRRAARGPRLPVVFVAFGAEEPRGEGDAWHHFGSRAYVAGLSAAERRAVRGMVSLDRVGVGRSVRIRTGGRAAATVADGLAAAARRVDVPVTRGTNRASDHWSFEKAGIAAARLGGNAYAAYHSAADRPPVVSPAALDRTGRLLWEWLVRD